MRTHPARTAAQRLLKKHGIPTHAVGTLALHVVCREYNERPLIIDIRCSSHEDGLARFELCHLYDAHSEYTKLLPFDKMEFRYPI